MIKNIVNFVDNIKSRYSEETGIGIKELFGSAWGGDKKTDYLGTTFAAIDTWGLYFAKAKFRLFSVIDGETTEIIEHPFLNLFNKPNDFQIWWEYAYSIAAHFGLFGNSYIYKLRNIVNNQPVQYLQLLPSLVERVSDKSRQIAYYKYMLNGQEKKLKREDVMDFRYPNPEAMVQGLPIVSTIMSSTDVNKLQMEYSKQFYEQGGFSGALFSTDKDMTPASFKRTLKMLQDNYSGRDRAYTLGLFDNGLKPIPAAYSIKEMDITAQRKLTKEDILEAFKVSKILIGQGESINRATAEASIFQFTSGIIDPVLNYLDSVLTMNVRQDFNDDTLAIRHDTLAPRDQKASLEYYKDGLLNGWLSINDVRKAENLNRVDGELADAYTINVGGSAIRVDTGVQIGKEQNRLSYKSIKNKDITWRRFDIRHQRESEIFKREMNEFVEEQRKRLLKKLEEKKKSNIFALDLFDEEEDALFFLMLQRQAIALMYAGYQLVQIQQQLETELNTDLVAADLERIINEAMIFNAVTNENINNIEANNKEEFTQKLNEQFNNIGGRIDSLIVTTTTASMNAGILQGLRDAGLTKKSWLTMRDARVRQKPGGENHVKMDGVTVLLDVKFEVPARNGVIDYMMYPGDPAGSPENVINDRCTIIGE